MKYYSVRKGKKPGIYNSWEECQEQVLQFEGAEFKSFSSKTKAEDFLAKKQINNENQKSFKATNQNNNNKAIAYSDGSYLKSNLTYSYGVVILWKNKEYHFSKRFSDSSQTSMWNVSGELEGAKRAMLFAYANKIDELCLYHDYEGIAKWANNKWLAKNDKTKEYVKFCNQIKSKVQLKFVWVKGHSGNKYNEIADQLAAAATFEEMAKEV